MPATYGRLESRYCDKPPAGKVASMLCGSRGNVHDIVSLLCQGGKTSTFTANDERLGDQDCRNMYKSFNVMYRCKGSSG